MSVLRWTVLGTFLCGFLPVCSAQSGKLFISVSSDDAKRVPSLISSNLGLFLHGSSEAFEATSLSKVESV